MDECLLYSVITGQKTALTLDEIRQVRRELACRGNLRDLTLFSMAVNTMLRSVDLLKLRVHSVTDGKGRILDTFSIIQQKTKTLVTVEIEPATERYLQRWIWKSGKQPEDFLFTSLKGKSQNKPITTTHYRVLVKQWVSLIGLDPKFYSSHSLRKAKAAMIYDETKDLEAVRNLLGHKSLAATAAYLGVNAKRALEIALQYPIFSDDGEF